MSDPKQIASQELAESIRATVLQQLVKNSNESLRLAFDVRVNGVVPDHFDEDAQVMRHSISPRIDIFIKEQDANARVLANSDLKLFINKCKKQKLNTSDNEVGANTVADLVSGLNGAFSRAVRKIEMPTTLSGGRVNA